MKEDKTGKIIKGIGVIAVIALLFFWAQSYSNKSSKRKMDTESKLAYIAEELHNLSELYYELEDKSYYTLDEALYDVSKKCEELESIAEKLVDQYREPEYEENRNSWFY